MFEQSILLNEHDGKKPWTFAVSILAEVTLVSIVLLIPLIYTERLGLSSIQASQIRFNPPTPRPMDLPAQRVLVHRATRMFNPFAAPTKIVPLPTVIANLNDPPPQLECSNCVAGAPPFDHMPTTLTIGTQSTVPTPPKLKPVEVKKAEPLPTAPIRVSLGTQEAMIIRRVIPTYPALAKQARVQGTVKLIGVISTEGRIEQLKVISGHPLLTKAAVEAVMQWVYRPTLLSGQPVEVIAPIDVNFILSQ